MARAHATRGVLAFELLLKAMSGFALAAVALAGSVAAVAGIHFSLAAGVVVGCVGASAGAVFARRTAIRPEN